MALLLPYVTSFPGHHARLMAESSRLPPHPGNVARNLVSGRSYSFLDDRVCLCAYFCPAHFLLGAESRCAVQVLSRKHYDGEIADVWSCGVTLYVMLVGAYPFEDPADPRNFRKTIQVLHARHSSHPHVLTGMEDSYLASHSTTVTHEVQHTSMCWHNR